MKVSIGACLVWIFTGLIPPNRKNPRDCPPVEIPPYKLVYCIIFNALSQEFYACNILVLNRCCTENQFTSEREQFIGGTEFVLKRMVSFR